MKAFRRTIAGRWAASAQPVKLGPRTVPGHATRQSSRAPRPSPRASGLAYGAGGLVIGVAAGAFGLSSTAAASPEGATRSVPFGDPSSTSQHYADEPTAAREIQQALGQGAVSTDAEDIESHGYSEWSTSNVQTRPVAVITTASTEDVSTVARICTKHKVPMIPFGAGSSVEGNVAAPFSGFSIDLSRLSRILEVHEEDMDVVGQTGVNWVHLNETLKPTGVLGHVGDGNFYQSVMYDPGRPEQAEGVRRPWRWAAHRLEEHGIGLGKKHCLEKELGPATIEVMRTLKRSLDPHWLLNPGKVIDP